ncbi:EAL and HDOD domain-containing protein [Mesobacillus harenae]|uniref:EAL and HDOD domain-containing protein n=1 Tax=Mesobacillus harenae TaxID=2213203 RepID=UPI0015803D1D|nr:HDOD domain-containing protein [Mesobacillus harenae]
MEVFVARQPIYDENEKIYGYELLYRNDQTNEYPDINGEQATADVIITSFLNIGIDKLSNGKPCFVNFTEKLLQLRLPTYFPPRDIVVELLETINPGPELLVICHELKSLGYKLALDDFVLDDLNPYSRKLLEVADLAKIDFLSTTRETRVKMEKVAKSLNVKLLAEKVETRQQLEEAKRAGYQYFQGYYFAKPVIVSSYDIPVSFQSYFEMIQMLSVTEPSIDALTELIERDLSLTFKLLKLINSPAYRPKSKIKSIRQAIVLLGLIEIQKWIYVLAVRESTGTKKMLSEEAVRLCLIRGKMCESVASMSAKPAPAASYFLTGMLSCMDTITGVPMDQILIDLPLQEDISEALKGKPNTYKETLDLALIAEKAEWSQINKRCKSMGFEAVDLFRAYGEAVNWSNRMLEKESFLKETL